MERFEKVQAGIFRLKIPFDMVYTSVFLIEYNGRYALMDCATTAQDVSAYILPALTEKGIKADEMQYIVISHSHEDHAGGLPFLREVCSKAKIVTDIREIFSGVFTYPMAGHTLDCIGLLDMRTKTLISADGIQGYGVDKYRCTAHDPQAYKQTLENIRLDTRIENILFSHAYDPWKKDFAFGRKEIEKCLQDSIEYIIKENLL